MDSSRFLVWGFASGLLSSAIVTYWPGTWEYAPGAILGATIAIVFIKRAFGTFGPAILKEPAILKLFAFVGLSTAAYYFALIEAQWVLGSNGFADLTAYNSPNALSAMCVASFVAGCIWAFILSIGIRTLLFPFDLIRGMFFFAITASMVASLIVIVFSAFGFVPQFIFPVWHFCMSLVVMYAYRNSGESA